MRKIFGLMLIVALPLAAAEVAGEALRQDAAVYAEQFNVGLDEAVRRLQLQKAAGDLEAALTAAEPESFAGLWIEHTPRYRVVASFTNRGAEARAKARVAGGPLAGLVETRSARWSLAQLEAQQLGIKAQLRKAGEDYNGDIDVPENRVTLFATNPARVKQKLGALAEGVRFREVSRLAQPETLVGATPGTDCTFGFPVVRSNGELGITTAGHCPNDQYYNGLLLPYRDGRDYGSWDIQWNSTCDIVDVTNVIDTGIGLRAIRSTRSRTQQTIGSYVCKNGRSTGRTCGTLANKNFDPGPHHDATFMRVDGGSVDLSEPGDSGAPWFVEDIAYGSHRGHPPDDPRDAIYMAVNYLNTLGVYVLTYDPGQDCNLWPVASFSYSAGGVQYSFDASLSYDPDGSIVNYTWDFGDGTVLSTMSPYISHSFGGDSYTVTLTVMDNEGTTMSTHLDITTCGGFGQPQCFQ